MKTLGPDDPRMIGEYRLRARLGAGGMGRVYLGQSPGGRAVAIKVVNPDLAGDAEFLHRFAQEVAAARAVSGIYTAPVVASGLAEHPPWLATAFVPGPPLDQVIGEHGPMPEAALWPLLAGLTEALAAIHACGVVHRDLKPANVLLATDGPRVIDFGISRAIDGTVLTAAGVVFGTPGYMSPEQAEGRPAGPASDMFALGGVIAYAAAGAGPFGGGTAAAVLYRVVHGEAALDRVPAALRDIVARCLAKNPADRPTPAALAAELAGRDRGTGPSAMSFWPRQVAGVIGAYQARLEAQLEAGHAGAAGAAGAEAAMAAGASGAAGALGAAGSSGAVSTETAWPGWGPAGPGPRPAGTRAYTGAPEPAGYRGAGPQGYPGPPGPGAQGPGVQSPGVQGPGVQGPGVQGPGLQGYPRPQGYSGSQGPLPPQGYGTGAPRGPMPAAPPVSYRPGRPVTPGPLPDSMRNAIGLMYAGAAYTVLYAVGVVIVAAAIVNKHPLAAAASSGRVGLGGVIAVAVVAALIEVALWLGIARACRNGRGGARVTGTVLFGVHTIGLLGVLANSHPGIGLAKIATVLSWLIACAAVVFLWQRPSSAFFARAAGRPS